MFFNGTWAARIIGVTALVVTVGQPAAAQISVRYEAPGVQASTVSGVSTATFDGLNAGQAYTSVPLATVGNLSGTITGGSITPIAADQYGGAGGTGNYLGAGRGGTSDTLSLNLTNSTTGLPQTAGYFGLWVSAIDAGNNITFRRFGALVATFNASDLNNLLPGTYNGNPNGGTNSAEKYVFLNFYSNSILFDFDSVEINRSAGGGFEFDNVSALTTPSGQNGTFAGTATPLGFVPVPEPAGLMAAGVGVFLLARRLRRR